MQICALQHPSQQLCKGKETWHCNPSGYRTDFQHSPAAAAGNRFENSRDSTCAQILFVKTHPDSQRTSAFWVLSLCRNSAVNVTAGTDGHQTLW